MHSQFMLISILDISTTYRLIIIYYSSITISNAAEVDSIAALVESVGAGLGLAMVSTAAARQHLATGKVKVIDLPIRFTRALHRISLRNKPGSPAARAFIELARQIADNQMDAAKNGFSR